MITELSAKNFKSWKDTRTLRIAPLTAFFGANSSGKTSILQVLLMLKQTVERPSDWNDTLDFGDEHALINLGGFGDVIYKHRQDLSLDVSVSWIMPEKLTMKHPIVENALPIETTTLSHSTSIVKTAKHSVTADYFNYSVGGQHFSLEWNPYIGVRSIGSNRLFLSGSLFRCYGARDEVLSNPKLSSWQFEEAFEALFSRICYLGPRREYPRAQYTWDGAHPEGVGKHGREMVSSLFSARIQLLDLDEQLPRCLQLLGLIHSYRLVRVSDSGHGYEFFVTKHKGGAKVRLTDVGFGVSQVLPVLILCYYVQEGSILILEQPEAHLHPKVQSDLADVLIDVVKNRNVQIILESHSEHLLHRLTRRIAEEQLSANDTALYSCQINDGTSAIEQLEIDEFGNVSNWPQDFFGDDLGDVVERTKAEMNRRKVME